MFRTSRMAPTVAAASAMGIMALAAPAHAGTNVPGINVEVTVPRQEHGRDFSV